MAINAPKITLIHATPLAMAPVVEAFERLWPAARCAHLLDDSLSRDLAEASGLNAALEERISDLSRYARACGADGILFTCSAFGPAIEAAARNFPLPILKPNEAMFDEALDACADPEAELGLLTTFAPAALPMQTEFEALKAMRGQSTPVMQVACAEGAMALLQSGQAQAHDEAVLNAARRLHRARVLMLGQFSMARARESVQAATGQPVLTSPDSAVRRLQRLLTFS